jgi:hypothetical protein
MSNPTAEKKPNRLLEETSPYLQQHAYNPVDWYPWGEEALKKAKELDRPIFLSIGYSSCHWCHVMERESFENPAIARILNENFISIKVDREERPDLDAIYMTAVQVLTGAGGWPMSIFLTPQLKPFWGGTYFPPETRYGRPGFAQILTQIAEVYRSERGKVDSQSDQLTQLISRDDREDDRAADTHADDKNAHGDAHGDDSPERSAGLAGNEAMQAAVEYAQTTFDSTYGGFGPAPKFPRSVELSKLLRHHHRTGDPRVLLMCEKTLEGMASGGMYDQIGGGFHRYSTDERWLVPHFEKMLYDNALLARTYLEAFQATGKDFYRVIAREILDYVLLEMTSPEGGFYSATDADSEGEEGKFFVWTPDEVGEVLEKKAARAVCEWFNITIGGNFEHGKSIPHVTRSIEAVSKSLKLEPGELRRIVQEGRQALYRRRGERVKPFRDEKIITSWNALMVSAFARGYQVLAEERYLDAARKASSLILEKLYRGRTLYRTYKDGRAKFPAYLDDHAYLAEALLDLYEATFEIDYLLKAREMTDVLLEHFWDSRSGGFFYTSGHHQDLICRKKDNLDGATPSGNGVAALNLLRLERLTGERLYQERALELFRGVKVYLDKAPMAMGYTILALDFFLHPPVEIVIAGDPSSPAARKLLGAVHQRFLPNKVLAGFAPPLRPELEQSIPLLRGKAPLAGEPAAYVCKNFACRAPVAEAERLTALLGEK